MEGNDVDDEMDTDIKDIKTSDEEWKIAEEHVESFKKHREIEYEHERFGVNDLSQMFRECYTENEDFQDEMDTGGEIDDDIPKLLRKKDQPMKIDENNNFKILKWLVGMTFETTTKFKDVIGMSAVFQGYDLRIGV